MNHQTRIVWTYEVVRDRCVEEGNCLLWAQSVNNCGYPQARIDGEVTQVARWVLEQSLGRPIKPKHFASPRCRNKLCCSMGCLREMPRGQLLSEAYAAGRRNTVAEKARRRANAVLRGMAILDMDKARVIRARFSERTDDLAAEFGVHPDTIREVWKGRTWKEVGNSVFSWRPAA